MKIGANYLGDRQCEFVVWAPLMKKISVRIVSPPERLIPMQPVQRGYWKSIVQNLSPGDLYLYELHGKMDCPDPASYSQPKGVHGPSQIVHHHDFEWEDALWRGIPPSQMIMYELHVGTFTPEGTFEAILPRLEDLLELGVNAIEIMPVSQFPGNRNWGYDGVYPFAVQSSYGGPTGLKRLVNECHEQGMAVILDVVYNHFGPEGNYLASFGPYFTDKYKTPWGSSPNFDDPYCEGMRNFFIENALCWFDHYHIDALRLDAIHAIFDTGAKHFLQELAERTEELSKRQGRKFYLIAESDLNDPRVIKPPALGGYGLDAQWSDDFHHALHTLLTGEDRGYYMDFGQIADLAKAIREGFVRSGQYSHYRKRHHGSSSADRPAEQFVVFIQNHDQVGNRLLGDRLSTLLSFEALKLAAGVVLLSSNIPLLFMGEEYGELNPFLYFVSHSDPILIEAVRNGRKEEFQAFHWKEDPPDPQSMDTFLKSKINWKRREDGHHRVLLEFHKNLIRLRKEVPALSHLDKSSLEIWALEEDRVIGLKRWTENCHVYCLFNFNHSDIPLHSLHPKKTWKKLLDSADNVWNGPGTLLPQTLRGDSLAVYLTEE